MEQQESRNWMAESRIRWNRPQTPPEDGSYVLLRTWDGELGWVCALGAYEQGQYQAALTGRIVSQVDGWAYLPYDGR